MSTASKRIYLDHNATSPLRPCVEEKVKEALSLGLANPNSIHTAGRKTRDAIDEAREAVAKLIGARPSDIIFTSGGTEANHLAWSHMIGLKAPRTLATSSMEHPCVQSAAQAAKKKGGAKLITLSCDKDAQLNWQSLRSEEDLHFVSIHHANNEVGSVWDIASISKDLKKQFPNLLVHTDAVQCPGKVKLNIGELGVNYLSLSAHKMGALSGVGALYRQRCAPIEALWQGGPQEKGRRPGTENVLGIVAMGAAAQFLTEQGEAESKSMLTLRQTLEIELSEKIPDIEIPAKDSPRLANTFGMIFNDVDAESLLIAADVEGFDLSTGAACSAGAIEPSHVYLAMGYTATQARSALRFSLGWNTTEADVQRVLDILPQLVQRARERKIKI